MSLEHFMRYANSTEYWLDTSLMTLRGQFEEMYQDIEDPWGCLKKSNFIDKKILCELIFSRGTYRKILDIGCGLGGFTKVLADRNGSGSVSGCDVSVTAVEKARKLYPGITFEPANILHDDLGRFNPPFDLIVISEVLWYILDDLSGVFKKIAESLEASGILAIQQYFPDTQKFGANIINGIDGFELFVKNNTVFKLLEKVVYYAENDGIVALMLFGKK